MSDADTAQRARMINFACRCSHRFSLPDDQAGGVIQCPQCHRLCDVPNLSDLGHLDADGNFNFDDDGVIPLAGDEQRLNTLHKAFTRAHTDEAGEEIDLRPTMQDVMNAGTEEMPYELADQVKPAPPKYDPLTGALIKPLDVKGGLPQRIDPKTVPMARRAVDYAAGDLNRRTDILAVGGRLLQPVNLFVMSVIVLFHVMFQPVILVMLAGLFLVAPLFIIGIGLLLAHFGCVVEDTGPGERDELPRPLRDAELHADMWHPFTCVAGAVILCYWPAFMSWRAGAPSVVSLIVALVGTFFVPAVLLTLCTSGSPANLRPDRLIGVIGAIGTRYFTIVLIMTGAVALYGLGLWRTQVDCAFLFMPRRFSGFTTLVPWWFQPWIAYPAFLAGVFTMHWFCWSLGSAYRAHHEQFPWILQRHVATRFRDRTTLPAAAARTGNANSAAVKQKLGTR
jgi:hypothetical protein